MSATKLKLLAVIVLLLIPGCDRTPSKRTPPSSPGTSAPATTAPSPPPTTVAPAALDKVAVKATEIARMGQPIAMGWRPGDPSLYIAEKTGRLRVLREGALDPNAILDLSGEVSQGGEQGLLGLAFSPDGKRLYLNFTNREGDTRVVEFTMSGSSVDPASRREVLQVDQPYANHNGGHLAFGPDGLLYIGLGDGGSGRDPHDFGQSLETLLGKMVRINPAPTGGSAYTIPADNPFRDRGRPEIYSIGLRNPWRYSFDRMTGDAWIGDVGQNVQEEIDFVRTGSLAGANFGWSLREGRRALKGPAPQGAVEPIHVYNLGGGRCAVVGGHVYRGSKIGGLHGAYLYSDNCDGKIRAIVEENGAVTQDRDLGVEIDRISSFGEGPDGEIYMMSLSGGLFRLDQG